MRCPFPGMDPYLERREIWPDFHDRLITYLADAIQPQILPKYAALTQDRLYVVEHDHVMRPDVSILQVGDDFSRGGTAMATAETIAADEPQVMEVDRDEIREPYLLIVEPALGNRVVTAIEVLSPDNKRSGRGRDLYIRKREELWESGANCVEIDLLRDGQPTVRTAEPAPEGATPPYAVVVSRYDPPRYERYAFTVRDRLPRIALPLGYGDDDILLDLPTVYARCYESGPYSVLLDRTQPVPGVMGEPERSWCESITAKKL
jgi:hypothetical protein